MWQQLEAVLAGIARDPAVRQTKRLLNDAAACSFEQALDAEAAARSVNLQGADTVEAFAAFQQKRAAFTGNGYRS